MPTLIHLRDRIKAAGRPRARSEPAPVRAAAIAGQLLGLVESGYFEGRPEADEELTVTWLTRAISLLDGLRTVREPTEVLDRLDALLVELPELSVASSQ